MKTSDFFSFALIISSDESQSTAHFHLQSLGEKIRLLTTEPVAEFEVNHV